MTTALLATALTALGLGGFLWLGFQLPVRPFAAPAAARQARATRPIPAGLPAPVEAYLRTASVDGETLPSFRTATYWGRGRMRPAGLWFPMRHKVSFVPGASFVREMEIPWYGIPVIRGRDTFLAGAGRTEISGLVRQETHGPHTDQAAFLALASESILLPSTDALQGRWEALDAHTARLRVPYRGGEEQLVVAFDPLTHLPARITADRYKTEDGAKVPWRIDLSDWAVLDGVRVATRFAVAWGDEAGPWSHWSIEGLVLDAGTPPGARSGASPAPD